MATRDLISSLAPVVSLSPQSATAAANGTGVDLRGFDSAMILIDTGAAGGTSPVFTVVIEESDDDTTYTAVADADLQNGAQLANITAANDNTLYARGYIGGKRYVRTAITTVTGTSPTLLIASSVVRGDGSGPATLS